MDNINNVPVDNNVSLGNVEEETPTEGSQPQEPNSQNQTETDNGSSNVPFHENPEFEKRVEERAEKKAREIAEKEYAAKAKNWEAIEELSRTDPEYAVLTIEKLEKAGKVAPGTTEIAKKQLNISTEKEPEQPKEEPKSVPSEEVKTLIENHPDIQFAKQQREKTEREQFEEVQRNEAMLQEFEKKHPDIGTDPDANYKRQLIGLEVKGLMSQGKTQEEALELAYKWVMHRDEVLEEYKKNGKIEGIVTARQENSTAPSLGGSSGAQNSGGTRALSSEEESARKLTGMTVEEYIKYVDDPNAGVID